MKGNISERVRLVSSKTKRALALGVYPFGLGKLDSVFNAKQSCFKFRQEIENKKMDI